ncbi:MAG: hypothetical protein C0622_10810 [Desulfuromonas sp.]|nr:MAG: hypothetical protein C0622_10810 [Desulfuromonas sp.]
MSSYKIYIVDDDPTTHEVLGEYLTLAGFEVRSAENGKLGLEMILAEPPDLVLLDVQMPEMDGFQMLDSLRKTPAGKDVQVLYLTSLNRTNLKIKGLELGAEDYITKPFDRAELFARIKGAIRRSSRYRHLESVMSGSLDDIGLADLLQTLDIGRKTALIKLPEMRGEIIVDRGMFVSIKQGMFQGEEALQRLLLLEKGMFTVHFDVTPDTAAGTSAGIQHSLLDASATLDEVRAELQVLSKNDPLLESLPPGGIPAEIAQFAKLLPLRLSEFVAMLPGDLLANVQLLIRALKKKD